MARSSMAVACCLAVSIPFVHGTVAIAADEPTSTPAKSTKTDPETLKIHLMDGSQVGGKLATHDIDVETPFGKLTIPVAAIVSLTPGLASHPQVGQNLDELIEKLGSPVFAEREAAQKALVAMGPSIRVKLARVADDGDTERRSRLKAILEEFDQAEEDAENDEQAPAARLIERDTIETMDFTVVGKIVQQEFEIASQYGVLKVKLSDIRRVDRDSAAKQDLQKTISVDGTNLVARGTKDTGIRVERGDKVTFAADGTITMTPWGNQALSTPDGRRTTAGSCRTRLPAARWLARSDRRGACFASARSTRWSRDRSGVLQLAVAMQGDPQNQQFPGEYRVKIRVKRK